MMKFVAFANCCAQKRFVQCSAGVIAGFASGLGHGSGVAYKYRTVPSCPMTWHDPTEPDRIWRDNTQSCTT